MKRLSNLLFFLALGPILIAWIPSDKSNVKRDAEIRNIIFLIGDGMGLATLYAGMTVSDHPLNIERCPVVGLQKTFSADNYITDSAGAGTALASGNPACGRSFRAVPSWLGIAPSGCANGRSLRKCRCGRRTGRLP